MHLGKDSAAKTHCPYYASICLQYSGKGKTHSSVFQDLMAMNWSSVPQKCVASSEAEEKKKKQCIVNTGSLQGPKGPGCIICMLLDHHHGLSIPLSFSGLLCKS